MHKVGVEGTGTRPNIYSYLLFFYIQRYLWAKALAINKILRSRNNRVFLFFPLSYSWLICTKAVLSYQRATVVRRSTRSSPTVGPTTRPSDRPLRS